MLQAKLLLISLTLCPPPGREPAPSAKWDPPATFVAGAAPPSGPHAAASSHELAWHASPRPEVVETLQPTPARVWLELPSEWMPPLHVGTYGRLALILDHRAEFELSRGRAFSIATVSGTLQSHYEDRRRRIAGRMILMPRAWVLQLEFDPLGWLR